MPIITQLNGYNVGFTESERVSIPIDSDYGFESNLVLRDRVGRVSLFESQTLSSRPISFLIKPGMNASPDQDAWRDTVMQRYRPKGEVTTIRAVHRGVTVETPCVISSLQQYQGVRMAANEPGLMRMEVILLDPIWRQVTPVNVAAATSGSITPTGNAPTKPVLTITPTGGACRMVRATITPNNNGGLYNYPLRFILDTSGQGATTAQQLIAFHNGIPIPFLAQGMNTTGTKIDALISTKGQLPNTVDFFYGSSVDNQITAQKFKPSGFDLASPNFSNTFWVYRNTPGTIEGVEAPSMWEVGRAINRPGSWIQALLATKEQGTTFQIEESPDSNYLTFRVGTSDNGYRNDADSIIISLPVPAVLTPTDSLKNIGAPSGGGGGAIIILPGTIGTTPNIWYIADGENRWRNAAVASTNNYSIPDAIAARIGATTQTVSITGNPTPVEIRLNASKAPTITYEASIAAWRISGDVINTLTSDQIQLRDMYVTGPFTIDTTKDTHQTTSDILYVASGGSGVKFTSKYGGWPLLEQVANGWTAGPNFNAAISYQPRYAA